MAPTAPQAQAQEPGPAGSQGRAEQGQQGELRCRNELEVSARTQALTHTCVRTETHTHRHTGVSIRVHTDVDTHVCVPVCRHADTYVHALTAEKIQDFLEEQLVQGVGEGEPRVGPRDRKGRCHLSHVPKSYTGNKGTKRHLLAAEPPTRRAERHFREARQQRASYGAFATDSQPRAG